MSQSKNRTKSPNHVLQGKLGALERHHPDDDHTELRRQVKALNLADYIRKGRR